ncbi:hypothetical protein K7432_018139 [Basidiobolus ranarum]|uniref:AMP-dependent synthetase/ligase domain-containing protein n=1 Tax=Basidiobolus ranarum TaxID=34480 RepID=A0ABR2WCJ0_9FUNG
MSQSSNNMNLLQALVNTAKNYPTSGLYYINNSDDIANPSFDSYPSLLRRAYNIGQELRPLTQNTSRQIVVLYFDNHQDTIEHFWGSLAAGFLPCILGTLKGDDEKKEMELSHLDTLFNKPIFLCRQKDCQELTSLAPNLNVQPVDCFKARESLDANTDITGLESLNLSSHNAVNEVAILLLTSGSTGNSKAVEHTNANVLIAAKYKVDDYQLESTDTILNWVGCDHVAGLIENHITPLVAGANQVQVAASVITLEPLTLLDIAEVFEVGYTFAPNFLLANIEKDLRTKLQATSSQAPLYNLSKLKRINSGGEANLRQALE